MTATRLVRAGAGAWAAAAVLGLPAVAEGAAPPNDAPSAPGTFAPFTAENGTPRALTAVADVAEAGPDAGVPRCLGPRSFARTVWYRVPATDRSRLVRVEAMVPSTQADETPDLAAFVQPASGTQTREPQACDGAGTGQPSDGTDKGAAVEVRVPAGRDVLVQAGRSTGQSGTGVVLSLVVEDLPARALPAGSGPGAARSLRAGRASAVALDGAVLLDGDPAQPACPAGGAVWRTMRATRTGTYTAVARGARLATLSVFAGTATGDAARRCVTRGSGNDLVTRFTARKGQRLYVRLGTDRADAGAARLAVSGPCQKLPLSRAPKAVGRILRASRTAVRVRITGGCLARGSVTIERRGRTVARGVFAQTPPGTTRTVRLRRARLAPGRYAVVLRGREQLTKRTLRLTRALTVR